MLTTATNLLTLLPLRDCLGPLPLSYGGFFKIAFINIVCWTWCYVSPKASS